MDIDLCQSPIIEYTLYLQTIHGKERIDYLYEKKFKI